jgi:hypothetical protein
MGCDIVQFFFIISKVRLKTISSYSYILLMAIVDGIFCNYEIYCCRHLIFAFFYAIYKIMSLSILPRKIFILVICSYKWISWLLSWINSIVWQAMSSTSLTCYQFKASKFITACSNSLLNQTLYSCNYSCTLIITWYYVWIHSKVSILSLKTWSYWTWCWTLDFKTQI